LQHNAGVNLGVPLRSIGPTLEAEALTVLASTTAPLTGRAIARLAVRGTQPGLLRALTHLVAEGVVHAEDAGPSRLYRLNRDHLLAEPVRLAARAWEELLARLTAELSAWPVAPVHASLFGSAARRTAQAGSDIDILVIRPGDVPEDDASWQRQLRDLEEKVLRWTGNPLAWFETTMSALRTAARQREPIFSSWREEAIDLAGTPLSAVLRKVSA